MSSRPSESFPITAIIGKDIGRRSGLSVPLPWPAPGAHRGGPGEWVDHADTLLPRGGPRRLSVRVHAESAATLRCVARHLQRAPAPRRAGSGTAAHGLGARHNALRVQLCVVHLTGKPSGPGDLVAASHCWVPWSSAPRRLGVDGVRTPASSVPTAQRSRRAHYNRC